MATSPSVNKVGGARRRRADPTREGPEAEDCAGAQAGEQGARCRGASKGVQTGEQGIDESMAESRGAAQPVGLRLGAPNSAAVLGVPASTVRRLLRLHSLSHTCGRRYVRLWRRGVLHRDLTRNSS